MIKKGDHLECLDADSDYYTFTHGKMYTALSDEDGGFVEVKDDTGATVAAPRMRFNAATNIIIVRPTPALSGIKHDTDKPDMSLLSSTALLEVSQVMTFGKKKYSAHNWRGGFVWSRPLAAALRHTFAFLNGEDKDPETGLSHLAHAICCLMFVLEFTQTGAGQDDRYKPAVK